MAMGLSFLGRLEHRQFSEELRYERRLLLDYTQAPESDLLETLNYSKIGKGNSRFSYLRNK